MLDVRRLRSLQAVARTGSLSAAARELGYTQPAISHQISALEAEVGTALVARSGRGVRLTDAGQALAEHAEDLLRRLAAAEEEVAAIAGLRAGRVRLAAFPSGSATLVPPALAELRARHPGVDVTLLEGEPAESLPLLRAGELDLVLAFSYAEEPERDLDHDRIPLLDDPLHAVLPAGHRLAGRRRLRLAELAGETWIAGCPQCRGHLLHECAAAGFEPEIAFSTDDYVAVQALVSAGLGVALLPELSLRAATREGVAILPLAERPARTIQAVLAAGRRPPAVEALLGALADAAARA